MYIMYSIHTHTNNNTNTTTTTNNNNHNSSNTTIDVSIHNSLCCYLVLYIVVMCYIVFYCMNYYAIISCADFDAFDSGESFESMSVLQYIIS